MKKTMKRYLSFLLAMLMLVSSMALGVSAVDGSVCTNHIYDSTVYNEVPATCETDGYKIYICANEGCEVELFKGDYVYAYGHKWGDVQYERITSSGMTVSVKAMPYQKVRYCTRVHGEKPCTGKYIEHDGTEIAKYYQVNFYNHRITDGTVESIKYANVAETYKAPVLLGTVYFKEGSEITFDTTNIPLRDRTIAFPAYSIAGWTTDATLEATREKNLTAEDGLTGEAAKASKNLDLYPVYKGETMRGSGVITYNVTIYTTNDKGETVQGTVTQLIPHGESPKYSDPNGNLYAYPSKPDDLVNSYEFTGWVPKLNENSESQERVWNLEEEKIYGSVSYFPTFAATPKNYTLEFRNYDGSDLLIAPLTVNLQTNLLKNDAVNVLNNDAKALERSADDTYIYVWSGKWAILKADGTVGREINLGSFDVASSEIIEVKDDDGNVIDKVIQLVPVYNRRNVLYAVDISMMIPTGEDADYDLANANVQVTASNGQLVASGKTDEDGMFRCYLYNQKPFTVTVATEDEKYLGTAQITFLKKLDGDENLEATVNSCKVKMEINPNYEKHCQCIHHNALLQPIVVRIFNVLYSLFNIKYVCCYDMYSTIGPLLAYEV